MVDIVESIVLQEFSARIAQRRNNIRANQALLRNPRKLNSVISTMGAELLTESQLENINQKVFRRDPISALDSSFNEADPRRGSLLKIRNAIKGFITDPANQHIAPEEIFAKAFKSEEDRANPELTKLFNEKGVLFGKRFDPETDIKFPSSIGLQASAQALATGGDFTSIAVEAIKGAVLAPIDNFAINVGFGVAAAGGSIALAERGRRRIQAGGTLKKTGFQRAALRRVSPGFARRSVGARAAQAVLRGLSFVPHPAIAAAARIISATVFTLSAFEAGSAAVREGVEEGNPGFSDRNPAASFILETSAGLAFPVAVKKLAFLLTERKVVTSTFKGTPDEVIALNKIDNEIKKSSSSLRDKLSDLEFAGKKVRDTEVRKESAKIGTELVLAGGREITVLRNAKRLVKEAKPVPTTALVKATPTKLTVQDSVVVQAKTEVQSVTKLLTGRPPIKGKTLEEAIGRPITGIIASRLAGRGPSGLTGTKLPELTNKVTSQGIIRLGFSDAAGNIPTKEILKKAIESSNPNVSVDVTKFAKNILSGGATQFRIDVFAKGTSRLLGLKETKKVVAGLGEDFAKGIRQRLRVIQPETIKSLQKESIEIRKVTVPTAIKRRRLEVISVVKTPGKTNIKAAGDLIENSSNVIRERIRVMTDPAISESVKVQLNTIYTDMLKRGFSEGAAAKVVVDTAASLKSKVKVKTASQIFEEEAAKSAKREPKLKPEKKPEQRFDNNPTDELDKVLADGAAKLGKTVDDLTLPEFESIIKKSSKILGILGVAIAAGALLPDDSEASVLSKLGKLFVDQGIKSESRALKNASNKLIRNKGESEVDFIERMLGEARKVKTDTINSADKRASNLTFNAKLLGLNLDRETTRKSSIGLVGKIFGSAFNNFRKMGRVGEVLTNKFIQVDDFSEIAAKAINQSIKESLPISSVTGKLRTNLTKAEGKIVHDLLKGVRSKGPREQVQTSIKIRSVLDDTIAFAEANGVPVVGYRQNYVPQIIKEGVLDTDKGRAILINHLVKTGQVEDFTAAVDVTKSFIRDRFHNIFNKIPKKTPVKIAGKVELSRRYDLPPEIYLGGDGKNLLEALSIYTHQVTLRVGRIKAFGVDNQRLEPIIKRLIKDGEDEQFIRNTINTLQGDKPLSFRASPKFNNIVGISRAIESVLLLGYAGAAQMAQITFTNGLVGPANVIKGIRNLIVNQSTREMVSSSAVVSDTMSKYILEQFGTATGVARKVSETALRLYGVLGIDRLGRVVAGASGGEYLISLSKQLAKEGIKNTSKSKLIQRQLRELDLSPQVMLRNIKAGKKPFTDSNLRVAMKRVSDITQFRSRPGDLPLWFQSDHARLVTQFKSFLFQSGSAINRIIIQEAKRGNFKPLIIAGSISPFVGAGVQELRQSMKEIIGEAAGESQAEIRKKGKFRREQIKRGKFLTEPRDWMGGSSISRLWNDATYTLALGVIPDLVNDMLEGKGLRTAIGPNVSRLSRAINAIYKDLDRDDFKNVEKELKRLAPLNIKL